MSSAGQPQLVSLQHLPLDRERAVEQRYSAASGAAEPSLCCPVQYDPALLRVLPEEILERDYGCGDPSRDVQAGETVLDLGSGGGKACYIASQIVGPQGRVWGVDMNEQMLALARKYQAEIAQRIGWDNVRFHKGRIQDLALDLERLETHLEKHPVTSASGWLELQREIERLRREQPMIPSNSVDVVISNCVLNLVTPESRQQLFREIHRVLRPGGRAVISDIVCDEPIPEQLQNDPTLWSGCISGAFVEHEFLNAFAAVGLYGVEIVDRQQDPWATVEGIEFRSITVRAFKPHEGPSLDLNQAVIYRGPWRSVIAENGQLLERGVRTAVSGKAFEMFTRPPFADQVVPVLPNQAVAPDAAVPFDDSRAGVRDPGDTKRGAARTTCLPGGTCCG